VAEDTRSGEAPPLVWGADIRTFLFADMRGYTRFTQEHGDDAASALAGRFADLVKETVPVFEGRLGAPRGSMGSAPSLWTLRGMAAPNAKQQDPARR